ncbi:hypothetical protein PVAP13_1NG556200 [Panicum virgatum]|uniref:Uncharacterized protein n=1 Tax=Panicum virgatum TaxID=38727 RepID=A0A8T0XHU3_PANVG|nr:hypothetical protein PVAP13_1NG556200 [Panicum virgatum]
MRRQLRAQCWCAQSWVAAAARGGPRCPQHYGSTRWLAALRVRLHYMVSSPLLPQRRVDAAATLPVPGGRATARRLQHACWHPVREVMLVPGPVRPVWSRPWRRWRLGLEVNRRLAHLMGTDVWR